MWDNSNQDDSYLSPGFGLPKAIPETQPSNVTAPQDNNNDNTNNGRDAFRFSVEEREFRESLPSRTVFIGFVYVGDPDGEGIFSATESLIRSLRTECGSLDGVIRFPCKPPVNINRPVYHNPTFLCIFQTPEGAAKAVSLFDEQVGPSGNRVYVVPSDRFKVSDVEAMANFRTLMAPPDAEFPSDEKFAQNARLWSFVLSPISLLGLDWKAVKMAVDANCAYVVDEWSVTVPLGYAGVEETREDRFRAADKTRKAALRGAKQQKAKKLRVAKLNKVGSRLAVLPGFHYVQHFFESKRNDVEASEKPNANGVEIEGAPQPGRNPRRHADWNKHLDACRRGAYITPQVLQLKFPTQQGEALVAPPRPPLWKQVIQAGADRVLRLMGLNLRTEHRFLIDNKSNKTRRSALPLRRVPAIAEAPSAVYQSLPASTYKQQQTIDANVPAPFPQAAPPQTNFAAVDANAGATHRIENQTSLRPSNAAAPQRPSNSIPLNPDNSFSTAYGSGRAPRAAQIQKHAVPATGAAPTGPAFGNLSMSQQQQQQQQQANESVLSIMKETSRMSGKSQLDTSASTATGVPSANASRDSKIRILGISTTK